MLMYVIFAAILGITSFIVFLFLNRSRQDISSQKVVLFNLLFAIIMALLGLTGMIDGIDGSIWWFVGLQILFAFLGVVFYYLLKTKSFGELRKPALSGGALLFGNLALGSLGFALVFEHFQKEGLSVYYALSTYTFLLPWFFMQSFALFASIPPPIQKLWYYPLDMDEPDFDKIDLNTIYLLELEFSKSPNDESMKNYKARAPIDMTFGEWFRSFVKNYNYKFQEDPIEFMDNTNNPYGWIFFTKPRSFWESKKFIDPDLTIKNNKLNEKTVIGAKRIEVKD